MIMRLLNYLSQRYHREIHRKAVWLYPDKADRAIFFLASGVEELEIEEFGKGRTIQTVVIDKVEDGWQVAAIQEVDDK
jgi:hypothetical protein